MRNRHRASRSLVPCPCSLSLVSYFTLARPCPDLDSPFAFPNFVQAAVVGDTVGDPLKDTSGPSLNILMKLMAIISLVFAEYFQAINNGQGVFNIES